MVSLERKTEKIRKRKHIKQHTRIFGLSHLTQIFRFHLEVDTRTREASLILLTDAPPERRTRF